MRGYLMEGDLPGDVGDGGVGSGLVQAWHIGAHIVELHPTQGEEGRIVLVGGHEELHVHGRVHSPRRNRHLQYDVGRGPHLHNAIAKGMCEGERRRFRCLEGKVWIRS